MSNFDPKLIDVVILCGGKGKRLQKIVSDRPKPMAEINQKPFLDIIIDYTASFGFKRFIFCTGYMGEFIKNYYIKSKSNLQFFFVEEKTPLGTGGALKNTENLINSDTFIVMNGDSFCPINFKQLYEFHKKKNALITITLANLQNNKDYGNVIIDENKKISVFKEKKINSSKKPKNYISAGIYIMEKEVFLFMEPKKEFSLEYDFFPTMIRQSFFGYVTNKTFIDIGTPERYKEAEKNLNTIKKRTPHV